jgi:hypothetical protein
MQQCEVRRSLSTPTDLRWQRDGFQLRTGRRLFAGQQLLFRAALLHPNLAFNHRNMRATVVGLDQKYGPDDRDGDIPGCHIKMSAWSLAGSIHDDAAGLQKDA